MEQSEGSRPETPGGLVMPGYFPKTGFAEIDAQHVELHGLVGEIERKLMVAAPVLEVRPLMAELVAGIEAHFAFEEAILDKGGVARADEHRADHGALLTGFRGAAAIVDEHASLDLIHSFVGLYDSLYRHILLFDLEFRRIA